MKSGVRVCLVVFACLIKASAAQDASANWDLSIWIAAATGEELTNSFSEAQLWSGGVFAGRMLTPEIGRRWWRGRLEYGFELMPVFVQSRPNVVYGGGFEPVILRWNSSIQLVRASPYVELAGGALLTTANFPSGDATSFNFMVDGGGGLRIAVNPRQFMDIGLRWLHISNANLGTRNPEFNGIEVRIGYHWMR